MSFNNYGGFGPGATTAASGSAEAENGGGYNPRTHSKVAEKEGFHMGGNDEPRTLYVGNLDPSVTEEFVGTLFGQIGVVTKTKVIFDEYQMLCEPVSVMGIFISCVVTR